MQAQEITLNGMPGGRAICAQCTSVARFTEQSTNLSPIYNQPMGLRDWTYALRIHGCNPASLSMDKFAEYVREFSALLGNDPSIHFAGLVKGSAVLRASVSSQAESIVQLRLLEAKTLPDSQAANQAKKFGKVLGLDGHRAELLDRENNRILEFDGVVAANEPAKEVVVQDSGTVNGIVVGIEGADDTVHVRLRDMNDDESRVIVRDMAVARELARRFRDQPVRMHVHGTWKRDASGVWSPHKLYADSFEDMDNSSPLEVFARLRVIPGNGWSDCDDPLTAWRSLRDGA